jgi:hypothetical protein
MVFVLPDYWLRACSAVNNAHLQVGDKIWEHQNVVGKLTDGQPAAIMVVAGAIRWHCLIWGSGLRGMAELAL